MKNSNFRSGLVSVSFRQHTPAAILESAKAAGLSLIEWGSDVHAPCRDLERLNMLVRMQDQYGFACSSYGTYFRLGETPLDELLDYVRAAKLLGTRVLRLWCGSKSGADMNQQERNELLEICRRASKIAEENDVLLCMECHRNTFTQSPDDAVWLMESVHSKHFRMYWQPFQWQSVEENVSNAKKIAPYAECIHVFHWKNDAKLPLGQAADEWRAYLKHFPTFTPLLLEFMPNGTLEELAQEASSLKSIIGETI